MKEPRGFTLLELLMVVIIVAILASLALPQYIKAAEKARATEALQLLGQIRTSEGRYKAQSTNNVFTNVPGDLDAIDTTVNLPTKFWWNLPANLNLTTKSASLTRSTGAFGGLFLGVVHDSGAICGTFAQKVLDPLANVCP